MVSVIIPTYKRAHLLKRAILSALQQTYSNFEILVINDSEEEREVLGIIEAIGDKRIKYYRNQRKKGGNGARNTGILKANGEYVAFLDDDDEWYPNKIKRQIETLSGNNNNWNGVYCGFEEFKNGIWKEKKNLKEGSLLFELLTGKNPIATGSTAIFKKAVFEQIGLWDENLIRHQDYEFLVRYFQKYKLAFINEILVKVYGHNFPVAKTSEIAKKVFLNKVNKQILNFSKKKQRKIYAYQYFELSLIFAGEKNFSKTFFYLKKSVSYCFLNYKSYIKLLLIITSSFIGFNLLNKISGISAKFKKLIDK